MLLELLNIHNVATTALLTNYWKSVSRLKSNWENICIKPGDRPTDLFKDNFLQYFIDSEGKTKSAAEERLDKHMWLPLATRTRFFRRSISDAVKHKHAKQIIILGSGFDTLAVRKAKYTKDFNIAFFEVDKPSILACKTAIYNQIGIDKNATYIPLEYTSDNLTSAFQEAGVNFSKSTIILWEGNTFYLEKEEVIKILQKLSECFPSIIVMFDYMHTQMQTNAKSIDSASNNSSIQTTLSTFSQKNSPFKAFFTSEEIEGLGNTLGIQLVIDKTAADLAIEYQVDSDPYYTAKPYHVVNLERIGGVER